MTEREIVYQTLRQKLDESGYGGWVSDEQCKAVSDAIVEALEANREPK